MEERHQIWNPFGFNFNQSAGKDDCNCSKDIPATYQFLKRFDREFRRMKKEGKIFSKLFDFSELLDEILDCRKRASRDLLSAICRHFEETIVPKYNGMVSGLYGDGAMPKISWSGSVKPDIFSRMCWIYFYNLQPEMASECRNQALQKLVKWFRKMPTCFDYDVDQLMRCFINIEDVITVIDPDFEHAIVKKCIIIATLRRFDIEFLEKLFFWAGQLSGMKHDFEKSFDEFRQGLDFTRELRRTWHPSYGPKPFVYFCIAQCYLAQKKNKLAEEMFQKYIRQTFGASYVEYEYQKDNVICIKNYEDCDKLPYWIHHAFVFLGHISYESGELLLGIRRYVYALLSLTNFTFYSKKRHSNYKIIDWFLPTFQLCKERLQNYFVQKTVSNPLSERDYKQVQNHCSYIKSIFSKASTAGREDFILNILEASEFWQLCFLREHFVKDAYQVQMLYRQERGQINLIKGREYEAFYDLAPYDFTTDTVEITLQVMKIGFKFNLYEESLHYIARRINDRVLCGKDWTDVGTLNYYLKLFECQARLGHLSEAHQSLDNFILTCCRKPLETLGTPISNDSDLKVVKIHEIFQKSLYLNGKVLMDLQQYKKALVCFDELLTLGGKLKWIYFQKGRCLMFLEENVEAREALLKGPSGIHSLLLLIVNSKILNKPHRNFVKKVLKICQTSKQPLQKCIMRYNTKTVRCVLDILVHESKRDEGLIMFRSSYILCRQLIEF